MTEPWQPNFAFYLSRVDDHPASFVIDLNAEPQASHPVRLQLRVPLLTPRADGLRDATELDAMGAIEDRLAEVAKTRLDGLYVGRVVSQGATEFFFYVPRRVERAADVFGDLTPYSLQFLCEDDPEWELYSDCLFPDPYALQAIMNRALIEQLTEAQDVLTTARTIDHFAYFESLEQAQAAATALTAQGFTTDEIDRRADGKFGLKFHRDDRLDEGQPDAFVATVLDIILPLDGDYDGWGCPVVKGP